MDARDTFRLTTLAAALLAAAPPASAAEADTGRAVVDLRAGVGYADTDGRYFGQYNGMNEKGAYGLFDLSMVRRDDATGTWLQFYGRNLGLDSRSLRFDHNRQGDWGYFVEYSRIPRVDPLTPITAVGGIGGPLLTIPAAAAGLPVELKTTRDAIGLGFDKFVFGNWNLEVRFRNEEKDGARLFARGNTGGGVVGGPVFGNFDFAPEPIKSTTRQLDAKINYNGPQLQLSGGYYGTTYNNDYSRLDLIGGSSAITPIALPPDNQSHQLYLTGGYGFTPTTRGNFKISYAKATQDDAFITGVPVVAGIGGDLQAKVNTTLVQAGITSRPMPKLTLLADLRYEDRDDKTPVRVFLTPPVATSDGTNEPRSIRTTTGKAEASYLLPADFRLTGGFGYEEKKRNTSVVRVVSFRETTEESSYRVELRRSMSETLTGAIAYVYSDRDGSAFLRTAQNTGVAGSNLIAPLHLADRKRDKVRLSSNWTPLDPLTIQFYVDWADDRYSGRESGLGPRKGEARNYSLDASYHFSDKWQGNAWYNRNEARAEQATCESATAAGVCPATAADPVYFANVRNTSDSLGLGFRGKPDGRIELGADLSYSDIKDTYQQAPITPATSTVPASLPDITTRLTRFNLFGKYALEKNAGLRLDYIHDRYSTNDWTWTNWTYADGTRILRDPEQKVHFIGVSYYHRWQ